MINVSIRHFHFQTLEFHVSNRRQIQLFDNVKRRRILKWFTHFHGLCIDRRITCGIQVFLHQGVTKGVLYHFTCNFLKNLRAIVLFNDF